MQFPNNFTHPGQAASAIQICSSMVTGKWAMYSQ